MGKMNECSSLSLIIEPHFEFTASHPFLLHHHSFLSFTSISLLKTFILPIIFLTLSVPISSSCSFLLGSNLASSWFVVSFSLMTVLFDIYAFLFAPSLPSRKIPILILFFDFVSSSSPVETLAIRTNAMRYHFHFHSSFLFLLRVSVAFSFLGFHS